MRVALAALAISAVALAFALHASLSSRSVPAPTSAASDPPSAAPTPEGGLAEPQPPPSAVATGPVSSALVPPGPYRSFAPPAGVIVRQSDAGTFVIETLDPALAGTTLQILAERTDGSTETLQIALPANRSP